MENQGDITSNQTNSINYDLGLMLLLIILLLSIIYFIVTLVKTYEKNKSFFKNLFLHIKRHTTLLLFSIPILTLIFLNYFSFSEITMEYIKKLSYGVVSVGVFSAILKYINTLGFVKTHIEDLIVSKKFNDVIRNNFEAFVFSDEFFNSISKDDLHNRWKSITFFKYKNKFPTLWDKMNLKEYIINNIFFSKEILDYYYKSFRIQYNFSLDEDENAIKILQKTDFTLVTNNVNEIKFTFWSTNNSSNPQEPTIDVNGTIIDGITLKILKENNDIYSEISENDNKKMTITLSGKKEYHIELVMNMVQEYNIDRSRSFMSSKIIDDIFIEVHCCDKLDFFFEPLNDNVFNKDLFLDNGGFKNKDIIMPGELFIIFIDKV